VTGLDITQHGEMAYDLTGTNFADLNAQNVLPETETNDEFVQTGLVLETK
jgi:hypothetical protein